MGRHFAVDDTVALLRLIGDAARNGEDVASQRRCLFDGLLSLIDADLWVWAEFSTAPTTRESSLYLLDGGWRNEKEKAALLQCVTHPWGRQHIILPLTRGGSGKHVTRLRKELVPDRQFASGALYRDVYGSLDYDDFLMSAYRSGPASVSILAVHRKKQQRRFAVREREIVHVMLGAVPWLCDGAQRELDLGGVVHLSPRLQQILVLLLGGDGRKQIAAKLGLSVHTVDDYIKDLYRHFAVSSRSELAARFMSGHATLQGTGQDTARW